VAGACLEVFASYSNSTYLEKIADDQGIIRIPDHEVEQNVWRSNQNSVRATAPGMAEHFHLIAKEDALPFPEELVLERGAAWTGLVVDSETGAGLPGAAVRVTPNKVMSFRNPLGPRHCITDGTGRYTVPRFTYSQKAPIERGDDCFDVQVLADDYLPARFFNIDDGTFPDRISLTRTDRKNSSTGKPAIFRGSLI